MSIKSYLRLFEKKRLILLLHDFEAVQENLGFFFKFILFLRVMFIFDLIIQAVISVDRKLLIKIIHLLKIINLVSVIPVLLN